MVRTFFYVTLEIFFSHHFLNIISLMWFSLSSVKNLQKELLLFRSCLLADMFVSMRFKSLSVFISHFALKNNTSLFRVDQQSCSQLILFKLCFTLYSPCIDRPLSWEL